MAKSWTNPFRPALFTFLRDLEQNNDRDWFHANKERYEEHLREPALQFISDFGQRLPKISKQFNAIPKPVGGSLFRIHRDVRFSKDKSPYKTQVGIHFRHKQHKDAHAPGFYLHLQRGNCFMGAGLWMPGSPALLKIRQHLAGDPGAWKRAAHSKRFREAFELSGESLKRPPKGFDAEHPMIEDLKRKSFIAVTDLTQKSVTSAEFLDEFEALCRRGAPLVRWLCAAVDVEY